MRRRRATLCLLSCEAQGTVGRGEMKKKSLFAIKPERPLDTTVSVVSD
jgi:hypothetical protein